YEETRKHPALDRLLSPGRLHAAAVTFLESTPVPAPSYLRCWGRMQSHQGAGQAAFLHGRYAQTGWWYYYLVAALIKSPPALFVLLLLAAATARLAIWIKTPFVVTVA